MRIIFLAKACLPDQAGQWRENIIVPPAKAGGNSETEGNLYDESNFKPGCKSNKINQIRGKSKLLC